MRQFKTRQDKPIQYNKIQNKYDKTILGNARQDKTRQYKARQHNPTQDNNIQANTHQ